MNFQLELARLSENIFEQKEEIYQVRISSPALIFRHCFQPPLIVMCAAQTARGQSLHFFAAMSFSLKQTELLIDGATTSNSSLFASCLASPVFSTLVKNKLDIQDSLSSGFQKLCLPPFSNYTTSWPLLSFSWFKIVTYLGESKSSLTSCFIIITFLQL